MWIYVGDLCNTNGTHQCSSCGIGHHLTTNFQCVENLCRCDNHGTPAEARTCLEHDTQHCETCHEGYIIDNGLNLHGELGVRCVSVLDYCDNMMGEKGYYLVGNYTDNTGHTPTGPWSTTTRRTMEDFRDPVQGGSLYLRTKY